MRHSWRLFFGLALALLPAAARGQMSPAGAPAPRIVSTVPAATLNLVLIGAAEQLVGVSKYDRLYLPEAQRDLPVVGDYETMNYEQLLALRPTALVIQTDESRIAPRLRETAASHHIELVNMRFDHIEDIWSSVRKLGVAAGRQAQAEQAIAGAQNDLKALALANAHQAAVRTLYIVSPKLMMTAGKGTFVDEMLTLAGAENLGQKVGGGFTDINREAIIRLAPDVLLIGAADEMETQNGGGSAADDPRIAPWATLPIPAATNHRIQLVTDGNALMASVNIGKNIRMLADLIHGPSTDGATLGAGGTPGTAAPAARARQGFTPLEIGLSVAVLALLAIIVLPKLFRPRESSAQAAGASTPPDGGRP